MKRDIIKDSLAKAARKQMRIKANVFISPDWPVVERATGH